MISVIHEKIIISTNQTHSCRRARLIKAPIHAIKNGITDREARITPVTKSGALPKLVTWVLYEYPLLVVAVVLPIRPPMIMPTPTMSIMTLIIKKMPIVRFDMGYLHFQGLYCPDLFNVFIIQKH